MTCVHPYVLRSWGDVSSDGGLGHSAALAAGTEHGSAVLVETRGTAESVAEIIIPTSLDPFAGWTVAAACAQVGRGAGGGPAVLGISVVGDLDRVAEHVKNSRYSVAVSVTPKSGWPGHQRYQPAWDLEGAEVELVVDSLNSTATSGG
ncbi:MAG: hypothetical protein QOH34_1882 [Mycobacterium sp.]|nr:hypothetical protein [Mycobacterium sp.]